jgi:hypothetical protein
MESREDLKPERRRFKLFQVRWKEKLGKPECPYAERYVLNFHLFALRLHVWYRSDDKRHFHNHPYSFITCCIKGSYTDVSEETKIEELEIPTNESMPGTGKNSSDIQICDYIKVEKKIIKRDKLSFGSIRFRKASHSHYVEVPPGGCVTFLITGPPIYKWGFWVDRKLMRPMKYFHLKNHVPCDEQ